MFILSSLKLNNNFFYIKFAREIYFGRILRAIQIPEIFFVFTPLAEQKMFVILLETISLKLFEFPL